MWKKGRQLGCTYFKKKVWQTKNTDCWILKYAPLTELPVHTDPIDKGKHYRINIVYKGKGKFSGKSIFNLFNRIVFFRPDKEPHGMINGPTERRVLSIGWRVL